MKGNLVGRQAEMRERWQTRWTPIRRERVRYPKLPPWWSKKKSGRPFGTISLVTVEELAALGDFIRAETSPEVAKLVELMARCAADYTTNEVLRNLIKQFLSERGGK